MQKADSRKTNSGEEEIDAVNISHSFFLNAMVVDMISLFHWSRAFVSCLALKRSETEACYIRHKLHLLASQHYGGVINEGKLIFLFTYVVMMFVRIVLISGSRTPKDVDEQLPQCDNNNDDGNNITWVVFFLPSALPRIASNRVVSVVSPSHILFPLLIFIY